MAPEEGIQGNKCKERTKKILEASLGETSKYLSIEDGLEEVGDE